MERVMEGTLDRLRREMDVRFACLHNIDTKFGFLFEGLCYCAAADNNDLKKKSKNLGDCATLMLMDSSYMKKIWIAKCYYQVGLT